MTAKKTAKGPAGANYRMQSRRLWSAINDLTEEQLRLQVVIPVLRATPDISSVTDVHGQNERGLDIIFAVETDIERLTYGLQLKKGPISGGGTGDKTVKQIVDQLELADGFEHPVPIRDVGTVKIDRFVVATSGKISRTAQEEIAMRLKKIPVLFWDGTEIIRRIHRHLPQLFQVSDGASASYLAKLMERFDLLDALDQIPGVAKRTLSQVFEEPNLRRVFDPTLGPGDGLSVPGAPIRALSLYSAGHNAVIIADQDGGKTSILRMLALTQARAILKGEERTIRALPVIIRAKDILSAGWSLPEAVAAEFRRLQEPELAATAGNDLEIGNYVVAVDGFSELTKDEDKDMVARIIQSFAEENPDVRLLVAARPVDFLTPRYLTNFYQYSIVGFDEQQSASLIRRWTGGASKFSDVAQKMVSRLREALQLPGSPIPATIGVMLHEEQGRFITNTAEAIDRYMVIRLGRYAHELGMKQEVDWARKQDLLSEVAFEMVAADQDSISEEDFVTRINEIMERQGDPPRGDRILEELVASGVLAKEGGRLSFFRTSFLDFFAAHHLRQRGDLDEFAIDHFFERRWGGVSVFAAGLRRNNSGLLNRVAATISRHRAQAIDKPGEDFFYGAYLCGRMLANSESADHAPKMAALRTCLGAVKESVPELEGQATKQYGNVGHLMALIASEQSFFVTVGVPWLRRQFQELLEDRELSDEERYFLASTYTQLGYDDCYKVLTRAIGESSSTKVLVVLQVLLWQLDQSREVEGPERVALDELRAQVERRLSRRQDEVRDLWKFKSQALEMERNRLRRLEKKRERESGGRRH